MNKYLNWRNIILTSLIFGAFTAGIVKPERFPSVTPYYPPQAAAFVQGFAASAGFFLSYWHISESSKYSRSKKYFFITLLASLFSLGWLWQVYDVIRW